MAESYAKIDWFFLSDERFGSARLDKSALENLSFIVKARQRINRWKPSLAVVGALMGVAAIAC